MKRLFLTSEVASVAQDIAGKIKTTSGKLRTAFITTPLEKGHENDDLLWHEKNKEAMQTAGFDIFEYSITGRSYEQIKNDLIESDVIYVEGGSLVYMMNQVRLTGFDVFLREFVQNGGVYIGTSTGSFIAAKDISPGLALESYIEDNFDPKGIGLVNFLVMPHWGTDEFKDAYQKVPAFAYKMKTPMIILTDTQYVQVNDEVMQIVDVNATKE
ncbi:MAG: Type 1 glutamine amidotransferase-like domain-containing protein [Patescibacteria group bacterium]